MLIRNQSSDLFKRANQFIPGGINSPVRAFKGVGGEPVFFKRGEGAYLFDEDDNQYVDYIGSWGPLILGHCHPAIMSAVANTLNTGLSFGAPTAIEVEIAEKICQLMPSIELVRMVNSGTEATMSAIRLARGFTGREKILKFQGCYHGHSDSLLVNAGSGALTFGVPSSSGVPKSFAELTLTASFNDLDTVEKIFAECGDEIACIIIEPIAANMNCILPEPLFLQGLRDICDQYNSVLIFDEVINGFRVALGGAQALYNVKPDLTTLGKIIGGGMPVGAFGGKREIMEHISPLGPVYQAGTLSGNPVAMAAGLATLTELEKPGVYEQLSATTEQIVTGIAERAAAAKIPLTVNHTCSLFGLFFSEEETINCYEQVLASDIERFKLFYHGILNEGIFFGPSAFETCFVSLMHDELVVTKTLDAAEKVFNSMQS